jgi:hypothetical protein
MESRPHDPRHFAPSLSRLLGGRRPSSRAPGRWLLHCHNLFHMAAGMMTEVAYDDVA